MSVKVENNENISSNMSNSPYIMYNRNVQMDKLQVQQVTVCEIQKATLKKTNKR